MTRTATSASRARPVVLAREHSASAAAEPGRGSSSAPIAHCQRRARALSVVAAGVLQHAEDVVAVEDAEVGVKPTRSPCSRRIRTPSEWKVLTASFAAARPPTSARARSRISSAALLVKVIAAICARRVAGLEQARDLVDDHARLARAGAGEHEARAAQVVDGVELGGFEGAAGDRSALSSPRRRGSGRRPRTASAVGDSATQPRSRAAPRSERRRDAGAAPSAREAAPTIGRDLPR